MLGIVVAKERPDLEEQKSQLARGGREISHSSNSIHRLFVASQFDRNIMKYPTDKFVIQLFMEDWVEFV